MPIVAIKIRAPPIQRPHAASISHGPLLLAAPVATETDLAAPVEKNLEGYSKWEILDSESKNFLVQLAEANLMTCEAHPSYSSSPVDLGGGSPWTW